MCWIGSVAECVSKVVKFRPFVCQGQCRDSVAVGARGPGQDGQVEIIF